MATAIQEYLVDLGLQTDKIKKALKEIFGILDDRDKKEQSHVTKQEAEVKKQVTAIKLAVNEEKKSQVEKEKQLANIKSQIVESGKLLQFDQKRLGNQQAITRELDKQQSRARASNGRFLPAGSGATVPPTPPGFVPPIASPTPPSPPGGGPPVNPAGGGFNTWAGAAITGAVGGITAGLVIQASNALRGLTTQVRHYIEASGPLIQTQRQFAILTKQAGIETEQFEKELTQASRGLVGSQQLISGVNKILAQNIPVTDKALKTYIGSLTDLARVQGKSVPEALQVSNQALLRGRFQMLPFALGVDVVTTSLLKQTQQLPENEKLMKRLEIITEAARKKVEELGGAPPITFTERMTQMAESTSNFFEKLAASTVQTEGFTHIMNLFDDLIKAVGEDGLKTAEVIGENLGLAIESVAIALEVVNPAIQLLVSTFETVDSASEGAGDRLTTVGGILTTIAQVTTIASGGVQRLMARFQFFNDWVKKGLGTAVNELEAKFKKIDDDSYGRLQDLEDRLNGYKKKNEEVPTMPRGETEQDPEFEQKLQKLQLDRLQAVANREAEIAKDRLDARRTEAEQALDLDQITAKRRLDIVLETVDEEQRIEENRLRRLAQLKKKEIDLDDNTADQIKAGQKQLIDEQLKGDINKVQSTMLKKRSDELHKYLKDEIAADRLAAQSEVDFRIQQRKREAEELERAFRTGKLLPERYKPEESLKQARASAEEILRVRKRELQSEYQEEVAAAVRKYAINQKSTTALIELNAALTKARIDASSKAAALEESRSQTLTDAVKQRYDVESQRIEQRIQQEPAGRKQRIQQLLKLSEQYQEQLMTDLFKEAPGTTNWIKLKAAIEDVNIQIDGYKQRLVTAQAAASGLLGAVGQFTSKFAKGGNVGSAFSGAGSTFEAISGFTGGAGKGFKGLAGQNVFAGLGDAFSELIKPTKKAGEQTEEFGDRLGRVSGVMKSVFDVVGGLVSSFQTQSPVAGALGGGLAAGGIGGQIGGLFGKAGGPIGAVIGLGVGGFLGFMAARAKKQTAEAAKALTDGFNQIVEAVGTGGKKLGQALQELEQQRMATIERLSGKKGGREQLEQILPQMDRQIAQLKNQREDLNKSLRSELEVLRAPVQFESAIRSISAIVDKYKEFEGAAYDSGEAQEFLNRSIDRFTQESQRDLNDAEQTAIENALQLNDLYKQREDILTQSKNAEYDVLTQGILERERTTAMKKGAELDAIRKQRDEQLAQINKQIELAKTRVDAEQQIFGLSVDRVALETQLATLQKQTIMQDMGRLAAMAGLVADLKAGRASAEDISNWIRAMGDSSFATSVEDQYSRNGRYGYGGFNGET